MPLNSLSEVEKAWLAGTLDSEGWIEIKRGYPQSRSLRQVASFRIGVANTNLSFLWKVQNIVGAGHIIEKKKAKANWRTVYNWRMSGLNNCAYLLKQLLPYLIIKTEKAKQAILLADFRSGKKNKRYGAYEKAILKGDVTEIEEIKKLL